MKLEDFYNNVLESMGFYIEDGFIFHDKDNPMLSENKLQYALPTKEHLKSILDETGKPVKVIFNPLIEDNFSKKNSNVSLTKVMTMAKYKLSFSLFSIVKSLILAVEETSGSFKLAGFYNNLKDILDNKNIRKAVDVKTMSTWSAIGNKAMLSADYDLIKITQVKAEKIDKDKFNVVTSLYSPLLDFILEKDKEGEKITELLEEQIRPKDISVLKAALKFMLSGIEDSKNNTLSIGSNSDFAGFESLLNMYLVMAEYFNEISEELKALDFDNFTESFIELKYNSEDLDNLEEYRKMALVVPSEKTLSSSTSPLAKVIQNTFKEPTTTMSIMDRIKTRSIQQEPVIREPYSFQQETQQIPQDSTSTVERLLAKAHGRVIPENNSIPNINNYQGNRPDLHVSHIYNAAEHYTANQGMYNNSGFNSRLNPREEYVPASSRRQQYTGFSRDSGSSFGTPSYGGSRFDSGFGTNQNKFLI